MSEASIEFLGFTGSEMKYSTLHKRWEIVDSFNKDILATMNGTSKIPFGMNQCTAGGDGSVGVISCMSIFSHVQGLLPRRQLAATRWSAQIPVRAHCFGCISQIKFCWKLPHFRSPDIFFSSNSKLKIFDTRNNSPTQFSERVKSETFY